MIIAFDAHQCRSIAYNHFEATIIHVASQGDVSTSFQYQYVCKLWYSGCRVTQKCNTPTDKLLGLMKSCNSKHNGHLPPSKPNPLPIHAKYDPVHHCMLVAMRCVASNRPFLFTKDFFYKLELQHIHAGKSFSFHFHFQYFVIHY